MKRKQKGFTIVELLAVIVLLAIITTIAMSGYNAIQKNLKEKAYDNLIRYIESKAASYASDTGNLLTNVDTLVKEGYMDADDEEGNVYNPITRETLNCHIVNIERDNDNLYGRYSNDEECDVSNLTIKNLNLNIEVYETNDNVTKGNKIENNRWTNKNVILKVVLGEDLTEEEIKTITWQSNITRETTNKEEYIVSAEQIINTNYSVIVETKGGVSYQASVGIKIDKQRPVIYEAQIERENEWTNADKKLNISASDGNGSGISGYYVGLEQDCTKVAYIEQEGNSYETTLDNGIYYICVKDKAGNYAEDKSSKEIKIEKIDKEPPIIKAISNPKTLGRGDYTFKENVLVTWSQSGVGQISCNPTVSKKTGTYTVVCTAIGNNGLEAQTSFVVKHSYPATWAKIGSHKESCNCYTTCEKNCSCTYGWDCPPPPQHCWGYCKQGAITCGSDICTTHCSTCTVDDYGWTCPQGGSLSGSTCYY